MTTPNTTTFTVVFTYPECDRVPLAVSPVATYQAPDATSNWVALGINGHVGQYNGKLTVINQVTDAVAAAGYIYFDKSRSETERQRAYEYLLTSRKAGTDAVNEYNAMIKATREQLAEACAKLKVPLPMHGTTRGMKYVHCLGCEPT